VAQSIKTPATTQTMQPDVSVVTRYSRQDTLARALQSLVSQRKDQLQPSLELILVDALGGGIQPSVPEDIGKVQWVSTGTPMSRPVALAAGIAAALGEFCIVLDDDDWFDSPHLQKLFFGLRAARASNSNVVAATTGVRLIDHEGNIYRIWDRPIRREQMLVVNWLPPQGLLFHTKTAQTKCQVDATLNLFEDWDLWLQLLQQGSFIHLPGVTANYLFNPQGSGVHDPEKQSMALLEMQQKWVNVFPTHFSERIRLSLEQSDALRIAHKTLNQVEADFDRLSLEYRLLLTSRSWKITSPLRSLSIKIKKFRDYAQMALTLVREARVGSRGLAQLAGHLARSFGQLVRLLRTQASGRLAIAEYARWIKRHADLVHRTDAGFDARLAASDSALPLLSVLMPVFRPEQRWIDAAIRSLQSQTYPNWELCMVDDGSNDPLLTKHLSLWAQGDNRIRLLSSGTNRGISAATNQALALARGRYVALMDQDDLLHPQALYWVAKEITDQPDLVAIYTDEDKIGSDGQRCEPYFKPEFDPILLLEQNFFSHLGVFKKELVEALGGLRSEFNGSQDHDLILRVSRGAQPHQIRHIPRVLYHWRIHAGSTSGDIGNKSFAHQAGLAAVQDHLDISLPGFRIQPRASSQFFQVIPRTPGPDELLIRPMSIEIIIPTRDRLDLLKRCIESIRKTRTEIRLHITIVDNGSTAGDCLAYLDQLQAIPQFKTLNDEQPLSIRVIRDDGPFNYSWLNNLAVAQSQADYIVLMNNDIEVIDGDWLGIMLGWAMRPDTGAVGAKLIYPSRKVQHGGVILGLNGVAGHAFAGLSETAQGYFGHAILSRTVSAVTAATLMIAREKFNAVGGLNEEHLAVAFNDVDLCLRLKESGLRNIFASGAVLLHHESASRGSDLIGPRREKFLQEIDYMQKRWSELLLKDSAYNPNLSLRFGHALADPPRL